MKPEMDPNKNYADGQHIIKQNHVNSDNQFNHIPSLGSLLSPTHFLQFVDEILWWASVEKARVPASLNKE